MAYFDTHTIVKELVASGTPEKQAEVFVARFITREETETSATKNDLQVAVAELKADIFKWVISILLAMIVLIIPLWFRG